MIKYLNNLYDVLKIGRGIFTTLIYNRVIKKLFVYVSFISFININPDF